MSSIDVQLLVSAAAATVFFLRRYPALLVFTLGHLSSLAGFRSVELAGQPQLFSYLPPWLYEEPNFGTGVDVMLVGTCLLAAAACAPPARARLQAGAIPPLPTAVVAALGLYFVAYFFSTRTIVEASYATAEQGSTTLGGGVYTLVWAAVLLDLRRRVDAGLSPAKALVGVVVALIVLDFLKGSTGLAAGVFVTALVGVYLPGALAHQSLPRDRMLVLARTGGGLGVAAAVIMLIRQMRTMVTSHGVMGAFERSVEVLTSSFDVHAVAGWANGDQGTAHVLMCTTLYDFNCGRDWRSITGAVEYTFKPAILVRYLHLQRTQEAAWELMGYFVHGGGINIFGEFYWNGGWTCLLIMGTVLVGTLLYIDRGAHQSVWLLAMSFAVTPNLVQGYGYGYAQTFRGLANGVFFLLPAVAYLRFVAWSQARAKLSVMNPNHSGGRGSANR